MTTGDDKWVELHNISIKYIPGPQLSLEMRRLVHRALHEAYELGREEGKQRMAKALL